MTKRPDIMQTVIIALEMIRRIPKGRFVTAAELHAQLDGMKIERDIRSVQRLLQTLSEHFDIERDDSSKPYRYRWKENARGLSVPGLSAQESLLLTLAERQMATLLPVRLMKSMDGFFTQARERLSGASPSSQNDQAWLQKVRVVSTSQPLLPPKIDPEVFSTVSDALYLDHWLDLEYRNAAGKSQTCRVMPLGLAQQGTRLYLVCRFEGYDNERSLALNRIIRSADTGLGFERPADFDLKKYDDDGRFGYGNGEFIELRFKIEKESGYHLLESALSEDQKVVELDGEFEITATVVDSSMLDWWLRGFGDAISSINKRRIKHEQQD